MPFTFPSGPTITVQVAFSSTPFATSPSWTDITQYVRSVKIHRGRSRELDAFSAGTCSVLLSNADRRFDPEHATGPYVAGLLPMKKIQIVSNYSGTTSYLFTGYVDGWPQAYIEQNDSVVNVSATDGMKVLEQVELPGSLFEMIVATDKPDHWWRLDETSGTVAYDQGFAPVLFNGTYVDSPTLGATGIVSYDGGSTCASFTGGAYLDLLNCGIGGTPASTAYALEVWFKKPDLIGATNRQWLYAFSSVGTAADASNLYADVRTDGTLFISVGTATTTTTVRVDDNAVHQVFATRFDTGFANFRVDGTSLGTSAASGGTASVAETGINRIGNFGGLASDAEPFTGFVSHVIFWIGTPTVPSAVANNVDDRYLAGTTGLSEPTGTRIGRVLDFAGIPTSDRSIDTGSTTLAAYDLSGQSALSYINLLSQSESGGFYFLGNGNANFRSRGALITEAAYVTSNCTFSDAAGGITYNDFTTQYDDQDIRNEARVTRSGGVTQFASNTESQGTYGRRTYSLSGLLQENDIEAQARAQFVVQKYKDPEFRVRTLTIKPHAAPTQTWPQVLQRELEDRISVVRTPQNTGSAISKQVLIQSIDHSFGADLDWTTTYELAPANIETDFLIYDDPVRGFYDSGYSYIY